MVSVLKDRGTVIEDGDGAVGLAAGIMLVGEPGARAHLEVALLPAQPPYDRTGLAVDLIHGGGAAGRDKQVIVVVHIYGIDVEVVDARQGTLRRLGEALLKADVVEAVPLKEHLSTLDVNLLDDTLPR